MNLFNVINRLFNRERTLDKVAVDVTAACWRCKRYHRIRCSAARWAAEAADWHFKHPASRGCNVEFRARHKVEKGFDDRYYNQIGKEPWFLGMSENVNFLFSYAASAAITNAIASLASSATWVAGWESAIIDNSANKYLDVLLSALVTVGTTPTTNTVIEINSVAALDDTPTWPDVFDGTTSGETVTSVGVKSSICLPVEFLNVDSATSNRVYYMTKRSLAALYGGICPDKSVLFTSHNTGVALNATAGNHVFTQQGVYITG